MAKIYSSQNGVMRGRIGNTVYRKGQFATIGAQYQPQVNNPRSNAQAVQRASFATATIAAAAMKSIINHSHEGMRSERDNVQQFIRQNTKLLSAAVKAWQRGETDFIGELNIKGVQGIQPAPYLVSTGSVPFQPTVIASSDVLAGVVLGLNLTSSQKSALTTPISTQAGYEEALAALGLAPGDQLSLVMIVGDNRVSGTYDSVAVGAVFNTFNHVLASRVTFVVDLPEGFAGSLLSGLVFNPALVLRSSGAMQAILSTSESQGFIVGDGRRQSGEQIHAAVLIRSRLDINGNYEYSQGVMDTNGEFSDLDGVVESYTNVTTYSNGSTRFLDNPVYDVNPQ